VNNQNCFAEKMFLTFENTQRSQKIQFRDLFTADDEMKSGTKANVGK
jgi:hypothetical protein